MAYTTKQEEIRAANAEYTTFAQLDAIVWLEGVEATLTQLNKVIGKKADSYRDLAGATLGKPAEYEKHDLEATRLRVLQMGLTTVLQMYIDAKGNSVEESEKQ